MILHLDEKGRCPTCHIRPLVYKRPPAHHFCHRCDAAFDLQTGEQIENWAWAKVDGEFQRKRPAPAGEGA